MDLEAQVSRWEKNVKYFVESDYPNRFYLYDYLKDMDGRRILNECLALFTKNGRVELLRRLEIADNLLKGITRRTEMCIWGNENAEKYGYDRNIDWWYFRRPKGADSSWDEIQ